MQPMCYYVATGLQTQLVLMLIGKCKGFKTMAPRFVRLIRRLGIRLYPQQPRI